MVRPTATGASKNGLWCKGDFIALLRPDGTKVDPSHPQHRQADAALTRDDLKELHEWLTRQALWIPTQIRKLGARSSAEWTSVPAANAGSVDNNPPAVARFCERRTEVRCDNPER